MSELFPITLRVKTHDDNKKEGKSLLSTFQSEFSEVAVRSVSYIGENTNIDLIFQLYSSVISRLDFLRLPPTSEKRERERN
jgi:hypothetical protein